MLVICIPPAPPAHLWLATARYHCACALVPAGCANITPIYLRLHDNVAEAVVDMYEKFIEQSPLAFHDFAMSSAYNA